MKAKFVNEALSEAYEPKDLKRVRDFALKSGGDFQKEIAFAERMARTLTNMDKAIGRAEAAAEVYGGWNEIVEVFYNKAVELGYKGPKPGERLEQGIVLGSKLPKEQQYKSNRGGSGNDRYSHRGYRRGAWEGSPILPLGKVDLRTGDSPIFNVNDTWNNEGTVEVWRDNKGLDTSKLNTPVETPMSGIGSILKPKPQEEIDSKKRSFFNYKLVFTSGSTPSHSIGTRNEFYHDQNGNHIGSWEMVDYVPLKHLKELILPYGKKISGYVYK